MNKNTINGVDIHDIDALLSRDSDVQNEFTVYEDIRAKLIDRGVPAEEIAFIHDANTELRKKELFAKVRSGQAGTYRQYLQMGSGTNVQDRLIALHDWTVLGDRATWNNGQGALSGKATRMTPFTFTASHRRHL